MGCDTNLVDDFVLYLNSRGFEPRDADEVPEELRTSANEYGWFNWKVIRASANPWIKEVVWRLPKRLPACFLYLIESYRFRNFQVGPLMFFANTSHGIFYEFSKKVFADDGLYPTLHKNGFLQFGNPFECNYDPVCFDMKRSIVAMPQSSNSITKRF